eukprot:SM000064S19803  [mRNA]  locus=s64:527681:528319:- [translate_table: standard]
MSWIRRAVHGRAVRRPGAGAAGAAHVPVLSDCPRRDGGIQGLEWYCSRLRADAEGDVAEEFLREVQQPRLGSAHRWLAVLAAAAFPQRGPTISIRVVNGNVHEVIA